MTGDEQVYGDRGNVRPYGTPGAKPMTYDERVAIAVALDNTSSEDVVLDVALTSTPKKSTRSVK